VLLVLGEFLVLISIQNIPMHGPFKDDDGQLFQQWLTDPDPDLCSGNTPTPVWLKHDDGPNPDWKPFRKPLSRVAANVALPRRKPCSNIL